LRLERQSTRAVVAKAEGIRNTLAYAVSSGVFFADTTGVAEVLAGVARDRDVSFVVVRDAAGRTVAARGALRDTQDGVTRDGRLYVTSGDITHANHGHVIGRVTLGASLENVRSEVRDA